MQLALQNSLFFLLLIPFLLFGCAVTPQPYSRNDFVIQARQGRASLFDDQEPVTGKVTLYEAMARAVKYNLDHRVKQIEKAVADGNLEMARYDLLPQLVTSAGYSARNNDNGSASKSLLSGIQSLESSTSQEKRQFTADIIYVWNILDFGVGYMQALQQADEALISEEWRRKAVQNIVQDVRYAFWRAVCAEMLLPKMDQLLERVEQALEQARQMEKARAQEPAKTLAYQQKLLETVKQLWGMRKELSLAKTELASLMNFDPGTGFQLALEKGPFENPERFLSIEALEEQALCRRPELRVEVYQKRISSLEVRKALLGMLPGLEINLGGHYDDNIYLFNDSWLQAGMNLSWNLFKLLSGPVAVKSAEMQEDLAVKRYLATAMMVLTQVNLGHQRYSLARKEYRIAEELDSIHQRQIRHAEAARKAQTGNELEEIRKLASALSARMHRGLTFIELQGSMGRIFHSCGIDPLPSVTTSHSIKELARSIAEHEQNMLAYLTADMPAETVQQQKNEIADLSTRPPWEDQSHQKPEDKRQDTAPPKKEPEQLAEPKKSVKIQEEFSHKEESEKVVFIENTGNSICIQLKSLGNGVVGDRMRDYRQRGSALKNIDDVAAVK
ncbi:MAG: TolC family protein [Bacteroidales bacterium]|nr:TolC family protein [Bacteroidales bacterium]